MNDTMWVAIIVAIITSIVGPVLLSWVKDVWNWGKNKIDPMKEAIEVNEIVDKQLDRIMEELECDRVWISQFHNGGHFYPTGKSIQKFSIFYEKVSPEVSSIKEIYQNIPVSSFPKLLSQLYKEGEVIYREDHKNDDLFSLSEHGYKLSFSKAIWDLNGKFIGIISISFKNKKDLTIEQWDFINEKVGILGGILDNYLISSKK